MACLAGKGAIVRRLLQSGVDAVASDKMGMTPLHYDGYSWKPAESKVKSMLFGIWVASASDVFVVGSNGTILHYDGKAWQQMNSGTNEHLLDVWGSSGTDVFAVGGGGTILHYDGKSWGDCRLSGIIGTLSEINSVWGFSSTNYFTVGLEGIEHRFRR